VAWRFRRSVRLPGGFRLNLSKSGLGYSWGFRGFRVGRDSRGRIVKSMSIPGTGLYSRQYMTNGDTNPGQVDTDQDAGGGCAGCLAAIILLLAGLALLGRAIETGNEVTAVVVLAIIVIAYLVYQPRQQPPAPQPASIPKSYEWLGIEVKSTFLTLMVPLKSALRESQSATKYEDWFEMELVDMISRMAAVDGPINPAEAQVYLDVFKVLYPRRFSGSLPELQVAVLNGHLNRTPNGLPGLGPTSFLFAAARQAGDAYYKMLRDLFYKVAMNVALADGPLSAAEQAALSRLEDTKLIVTPPEENVAASPGGKTTSESCPSPVVPARSIEAIGLGTDDSQHAIEEQNRPFMDPQFTCATGVVTLDTLKNTVKELIDTVEPLLKEEPKKDSTV